ncbi:MAG: hypothetical protein V9H26_05780 [Verrucomicrobiota bacterium]|nr:hypothetical protein [Verrucomicrobiota bacterium]MCC6822132.1 hypothetical protein [Limisphaerales bacterium]
MNEKANARLTFAILDRQKGFAQLTPAKEEEYPLPAWYRAVCETPLDELGLKIFAELADNKSISNTLFQWLCGF